MTALVVAYPELGAADRAWIEALRREHDPHHPLIAPHFTLVFPLELPQPDALAAHVAACVQNVGSIAVALRCATVVKDAFSPLTHLFLIPDEGNSALVKLHDVLYTGMLAASLRLDVPFIPHITIGAHADPLVSKRTADEINRQPIAIHGRVAALDVVVHEHDAVTPIRRIDLA